MRRSSISCLKAILSSKMQEPSKVLLHLIPHLAESMCRERVAGERWKLASGRDVTKLLLDHGVLTDDTLKSDEFIGAVVRQILDLQHCTSAADGRKRAAQKSAFNSSLSRRLDGPGC